MSAPSHVSHRPWLVLSWACLCLAVLASCSEIPANNPYDPATPAAQQAPGAVTGRFALPAGFDVTLLTGAEAALQPLQGDADASEADAQRSTLGEKGAFHFDGVVAGAYLLEATIPGFLPVSVSVLVTRGQTANLGGITLVPVPTGGGVTGTLVGTAQRGGAPNGGHGGIRVEAEGTPYAVETTADGRFHLDLPPAPYTLRFIADGYSPGEVSGLRVAVGQETAVPQPVVLTGQPGAVSGSLTLPVGFDTSLLTGADLLLRPMQGDPEAAVTDALHVTLGETGSFHFEPVSGGPYLLEASIPGFLPLVVPVIVVQGETADLGALALVAVPTGSSEYIEGVARRAEIDAPDGHGGIQVLTLDTPYGATTLADGHFRIRAVPGDVTLRFAAPDHRSVDLSVQSLAPGEARILGPEAIVTLPILPASLSGRALRLSPGRDSLPAVGASVSLLDVTGALVDSTAVGADGGYRFAGRPAGDYSIHLALADHRAVDAAVTLRAGETIQAPELVLDLVRGTLVGRVDRQDAPGLGGVTVIARRTVPVAGAEVSLDVLTIAPDDTFRLAGLPAGRYDTWALADGYVTQGPASIEVGADAEAVMNATLPPRAAWIDAPVYTADNPVTVTVHGDADLTFVRIWADSIAPPDGLAFAPLPADSRVTAGLVGDGRHLLRAELASPAYVDRLAGAQFDAFLAAVSPVAQAEVRLDTEPPIVVSAAVAGGLRWVRGTDIDLTVVCADGQSSAEDSTVEISGTDGSQYAGPYRPSLPFQLGAQPGDRTLSAVCIDAAGHRSDPATISVGLDDTAPSVATFFLQGGAANESTSSEQVHVTYGVSDPVSGVEGIAIAEDNLDCANATYQPPGNGSAVVALTAGDGTRTLTLCVRDHAGNVTAPIVSSNAVVLDTVAPPAPQLRLASGAPATHTPSIDFAVDGLDPDARLFLAGDLDVRELGLKPNAPSTVGLSPGDGPKLVRVAAVDRAGNTSPEAVAFITLDTVPPSPGHVSVADGQLDLNTRTVPIDISDTAPDLMAVYEVPSGADCGSPACDDPRSVPFAPASTLTLSPSRGAKRVCWRFCDLAGNQTLVGFTDPEPVLGPYVSRPTPVLETLTPVSVPALISEAEGAVTLRGRGIASDTQAQLGEFLLPCVPDVPAPDCEPDAGGGCDVGGLCEQTCAESCIVTLQPALTRRAGTYVVRLVTPDPVVGGAGTSAGVAFLDVVAPVPELLSIDRRGVIQVVDPDTGAPDAQRVTVQIRGKHLTDNATFRLGPNYGRVTALGADPLLPAETIATVELTTEGIVPDDLLNAELVAANPPPGGGDSAPLAFGVNPDRTTCPKYEDCVSNLRGTRAPLPNGRALAQGYTPAATATLSGLEWRGGTAARIFTAAGTLAARIRAQDAGGQLPLPWSGHAAVELEDTMGTGPAVRLGRDAATMRSDGTFAAGVGISVPQPCVNKEVAVHDLNRDGLPDLLVVCLQEALVRVAVGGGHAADDFTWLPALTTRFSPSLYRATVADLDLDGNLDLAVGNGCVHAGRGDGTFEPCMFDGTRQGEVIEAADLDGDRVPDIVSNYDRGLQFADLDGDGVLDVLTVTQDHPTTLTTGFTDLPDAVVQNNPQFAVGDVNGDGALDVVAKGGIWLGSGDGTFAPSVPLNALPSNPAFAGLEFGSYWTSLSIADITGDGIADILVGDYSGHDLVRGSVDGVFVADPPVVAGFNCSHQTLVDLDNDGALDVVSTCQDGILVELGGGRPTVTHVMDGAPLSPNGALPVQVLDIDGDGRADVANGHRWARALPGGGFGPPVGINFHGPQTDWSYEGLTPAHFNRDSLMDFIGDRDERGNLISGIAVWIQQPGGGLSYGAYDMGGKATVADLNGDGLDDVVALGANPVHLDVRRGNSDGTLTARAAYPLPPLPANWIYGGLAIADVNRDRRPDVLVGAWDSSSAAVAGWCFLGQPGGTLGPAEASACAGDAVALGDVDGDGAADCVTSTWEHGSQPELRLNDGRGNFGPVVQTLDGISSLKFLDINGDGALDLPFRLNDGHGHFGTPWNPDMFGATDDIPATWDLGDLTGDGIPELVTAAAGVRHGVEIHDLSGSWTQELTDMPAPNIALTGAETRTTVHQAMQWLDHLAVVVRIEGTNLQSLRVRLQSPNGREVLLDDGHTWAGHDVWQAHYSTTPTPADLTTLQGWEPEGDWTLIVEGGDHAQAALKDFRVLTHGAFAHLGQ